QDPCASYLIALSACMPRPPPRSTLFPYTTLFRSSCRLCRRDWRCHTRNQCDFRHASLRCQSALRVHERHSRRCGVPRRLGEASRSEEHTSELQSRENLVCRLLLEKKKADGVIPDR